MARDGSKRQHAAESTEPTPDARNPGPSYRALACEERLRLLVENSSDLVAMVDAQGVFQYQSPSSEPLLGYRPEELLGENALSLVHPDDVETVRRVFVQLAPGQHTCPRPAEMRFRHKDGSWRFLEVKARKVQDEAGTDLYILNSWEITRRKKAESELRESEERFRGIFEQGAVGVGLTDAEHRFVRANSAFCAMIGSEENEIVGRSVLDFTAPEHREATLEGLRGLYAGSLSVLDIEKLFLRRDGGTVWARVSSSLVRDKDGVPVGAVATVQDITDQKKAEESLRLAQFSVNHAGLGMFWVDPEGRYVGVNDYACSLLGYSREELLTMRIPDVDPLAPEPWADHWGELKEKGFLTFESIHRTKGGEIIPIQATANYVEFAGKEYNFGLVADLSERKRAEESLRLAQLTVDRAGDLILWVAADGSIVHANESCCRRHGYSREEMLERTLFDLDPTTSPGIWPERFRFLREQGATVFESMHLTKDGEIFPIELSVSFVESGGREFVFGFCRDISERKQAERDLKESEERLRQALKMEAVGHLAGGIAHDFNNLLTVILGNCSLLLSALGPADPNREIVADIEEVGERAAGLTRQILAFSRRQILKPRVVQVNDIVLGMEALLRRTLGEDIELHFSLEPGLRETEVDPHQMEQVVMNLALNARDAMPEGGRLSVETANVELDQSRERSHADVEPGSYATLVVSDTGVGMDQETSSLAFDPFFTTKEVGKGTGLGLSTVFGIVKQSGGSVFVHSEPGKGSTFRVYLPASASAPVSPEESSTQAECSEGDETILVVEDEESVRNLVARVLSRAGYDVVQAGSIREVDAVLQAALRTPDLLLTDVVLPGGGTGGDVAEMLRARCPGIKVIFMSGYTRGSVVRDGRLEEGIEFLEKPFTRGMLLEKIRAVLDSVA